MKLLHPLQKCDMLWFLYSKVCGMKPASSVVKLKAVDSVTGGGRREVFLPNESFFFCQQTVDASSREGNISSELWVHFPPLSWNLPSLNMEQPVDSAAAPCLLRGHF